MARPRVLIALDLAAILVEANARGLLGVKGHGLEVKALLEEASVVDGPVPDFLVLGNMQLDANATMPRINEEGEVIGRRTAAQRAPMVPRSLLRIEHLHKLRRAQSNLAVLRPVRRPYMTDASGGLRTARVISLRVGAADPAPLIHLCSESYRQRRLE